MDSLCQVSATLGIYHCEPIVPLHLEQNFVSHVAEWGLSYGTKAEFEFRKNLFIAKDAEINRINSEQTSFTVGHNQFSTWTNDEMKRLNGFKMPKNVSLKEPEMLDETSLPSSVNWIEKGAVNAVKN